MVVGVVDKDPIPHSIWQDSCCLASLQDLRDPSHTSNKWKFKPKSCRKRLTHETETACSAPSRLSSSFKSTRKDGADIGKTRVTAWTNSARTVRCASLIFVGLPVEDFLGVCCTHSQPNFLCWASG
eukprot:3221785-Amphidinium_carterae.1